MITIDEVRALEFAIDKVDASGSEVKLDAATLAALETIELGATTLAALENVVVSGEVALDTATLAALENVVVSGEVSLDAATLAALETVSTVEAGYANWKSTAHSASSTASQIAATPLTGRINVTIQNLGTADIFIGESNAVTVATGTKIAKGSSFSEKLAAGANIWVICASGSSDLRVSEFAL